jgi:hypothetical protein
MNVAAFTKAASIIGGHNTAEEFLAYNIWLLTKCEFEVKTNETSIEGRGPYAKSYSNYWQPGVIGDPRSVDRGCR